jgi:hypothetical protein
VSLVVQRRLDVPDVSSPLISPEGARYGLLLAATSFQRQGALPLLASGYNAGIEWFELPNGGLP